MASRRHMGDINKMFLANTIQCVESHNRREQEVDCWRQHKLLEKIRADDLSDTRNDHNGVISRRVRCFTEAALDVDSEERARWAAKKVIFYLKLHSKLCSPKTHSLSYNSVQASQMTITDGSHSSFMHVSTATDHNIKTKDVSETKRSKKEKKTKRDRQEVSKEKKKEKKEKKASRKVTRDVVVTNK